MQYEHTQRRTIAVALALSLGLAFAMSLVVGLVLAQGRGPGEERWSTSPGVDTPPELEVEVRWLILDTVRPVDEVLPPLLEGLAALQGGGGILSFDETPRASTLAAVPGLRVVAWPRAWGRLRHLPGVLDVRDTLPPPPPTTGGVGVLFLSTATITGRVTQADGVTPLAGADVLVYDAVSYASIGGASGLADASGYYTATVTAPFDQAKVWFDAPSYAPEWYDDEYYFSAADAIDLSAGGMVPNVNASLDKAGVISGTVKFDGGGLPVVGVWVDVYSADGSYGGGGKGTDANGQYAVSLRAGTYKVWFDWNRDVAPEWYQDRDSQAEADSVTVTAGQTTTVDADVAAAGVITGVVTDGSTGLPVPTTVLVRVYDQSGGLVKEYGATDLSGNYRVGGLGTGDYKVLFRDPSDFYDDEYYDDKSDRNQADPVSVTAGITTPNVNATLTPFVSLGTITGTIMERSWPMVLSPLDSGDNVRMYFYDAGSGALVYNYPFWGDGSTTAHVTHVPSGTYKILFVEDAYAPQYVPEWYDNQTSYASADVIAVSAGMMTTDVNVVLPLPRLGSRGCISGVVTADGTNLSGVEVRVYAVYAEDYHRDYTDPNGEYEICGLLGDYEVRFVENPYMPEWFDGVLARTDATSVTVTVDTTVPDVNAALNLGGCVSGQVTDISGLLLGSYAGLLGVYDSAGNRAEFYDQDTLGTGTPPENDGSFVFCGLPSGDYVVGCWSYDGALSGSAPATIIAGDETSGVTCVVARQHLYLPIVLRNG